MLRTTKRSTYYLFSISSFLPAASKRVQLGPECMIETCQKQPFLVQHKPKIEDVIATMNNVALLTTESEGKFSLS